jgi:hypothetical protein
VRTKKQVDLTRATALGPEVVKTVDDLFIYHPWAEEQIARGSAVRSALQDAYEMIIEVVPPCPTRTRALNCLTDARMLANAAITHKGKY